ncbi:MAG: hypothetical protein A2Z29_05760 [Chloroflexi bacterium RBG_16_56_11]|nr:MAG: hypothetical protein A2Z29_05760 [Chloroflexi bacterium RBG_16_56_11]
MDNDSELTSYDSISVEEYLAHIERPDSWNNLYERPSVLSHFPSFRGKNVLDIGVSSGFYTGYALAHGAEVTAIDISQAIIDRLTSQIQSPNLRLIGADITQPMPFLDSESFDYVICSLVLHYIKDWPPVLAELYRVMKRGGRLVISTHHPLNMYLYLKPKSYFDFKLVEDTWGERGPRPFNVHYYIRPLADTLRPIIQSKFKIVSIEEPLPDEKCNQVSPEIYKRLSERPGFLFIVLEK